MELTLSYNLQHSLHMLFRLCKRGVRVWESVQLCVRVCMYVRTCVCVRRGGTYARTLANSEGMNQPDKNIDTQRGFTHLPFVFSASTYLHKHIQTHRREWGIWTRICRSFQVMLCETGETHHLRRSSFCPRPRGSKPACITSATAVQPANWGSGLELRHTANMQACWRERQTSCCRVTTEVCIYLRGVHFQLGVRRGAKFAERWVWQWVCHSMHLLDVFAKYVRATVPVVRCAELGYVGRECLRLLLPLFRYICVRTHRNRRAECRSSEQGAGCLGATEGAGFPSSRCCCGWRAWQRGEDQQLCWRACRSLQPFLFRNLLRVK